MSKENLFWDICFICNNSCQTCKTKVILSDGKVRFILKGFGKSGIFNPTDLTALKEPNARESCPLLPPPWGWFGSRYKHRVSIYELRFSPLSPSSQPSSSLQEAEKERITQEGTVFSTFNRMEVETIYMTPSAVVMQPVLWSQMFLTFNLVVCRHCVVEIKALHHRRVHLCSVLLLGYLWGNWDLFAQCFNKCLTHGSLCACPMSLLRWSYSVVCYSNQHVIAAWCDFKLRLTFWIFLFVCVCVCFWSIETKDTPILTYLALCVWASGWYASITGLWSQFNNTTAV